MLVVLDGGLLGGGDGEHGNARSGQRRAVAAVTARQLVIRMDDEQARLWAEMLDRCVRAGAKVAVVTGDVLLGTDRTYEGVLLEVDPRWLRVQPVDADDVPCAPSEYVPRAVVDRVVVCGDGPLGWLADHLAESTR